MSKYESVQRISLPVASDQSANMYKFVKGSGAGVVVNDTEGGPCIGILDSPDGDAAGKVVPVVYGGVSKVVLGATTAAWANVQSDANGAAIAALTGDYSQGTLLAGGDAGDVVPILLRPNAQLN